MLTKAQIKHLQGLKLKKYRQNYTDFVIEGDKLITEALLGNVIPDLLIATPEWLKANAGTLPEYIQVAEADANEMAKISSLSTPSPVLALVKKQIPDLQRIHPETSWVIALDDIRDPGNLGTILRTADWFGINAVVCSEDCVELYNPKVIQSTMGAIFRVQVVYTNLAQWITSKSVKAYAAVLDGEDIRHVHFGDAGVLVIGSESHGISPEVKAACQHQISIPGFGRADSLNASVAAAICMHQLRLHA